MKTSVVKQIKDSIIALFKEALEKSGCVVDVNMQKIALSYPPNVEQGDATFNCFPFVTGSESPAKKAAILAQKATEYINSTRCVSNAEAIGPYVNITLPPEILFKVLCKEIITDDTFGKNTDGSDHTVVVEFSSPNTNKPQHLGHVRNNTLGVAISNLFEANGYQAFRANLVNDRGVHICKSMLAYQLWGDGSTPKSTGKKGDHFVGDWYVRYNTELKTDSSLEDKVREMLRKFENGDEETVALWKKMNGWVYEGFNETYYNFGVAFSKWYFESDTCHLGRKIVEKGLLEGIFYKDEKGSILYDLPPEIFGLNAKNEPKKVTLLRDDGTSLYLTQDLGTANLKFQEFLFARSIYIVGAEQKEHFKYLFHILEQLGFGWAKNCHHLSYGMVNLPEGKMKSREGIVVDADDLLENVRLMLVEELKKRNLEDLLSKIELYERSLKMALAAIKIFLLKYNADTTIKFDPKASISFEGFTGIYILYAYTRAMSILRKAMEISDFFKMDADFSLLGNNIELLIARLLLQFPETVKNACDNLDPSCLAKHIYELAKTFNQFYNSAPVLTANNAELKKARLQLVKAVAIVIKKGLYFLGIDTIDRM